MVKTGKFVVTVVNELTTNEVIKATNGRLQGTSRETVHPRKFIQITCVQRLECVLSQINRFLIGFIMIYVFWLCLRQKPADIPWHACLCTLGFTCLMAEGLMAHYRGNTGTQICQRPEKTRTHWILQLLGSLLGIAGVIVKIDLEELHFPTLHGQLGLAAFILCLFSLGSGLGSLYATELKDRLKPLLNKTLHAILGLLTFTLAMLSTLTSFETELFIRFSVDAAYFLDFRLILKVVTVLIWLLSSYGPFWCLIYSKLWNGC